MKIRQKLMLGFLIITVLVGIIGAVAWHFQNKIIEQSSLREINVVKQRFSSLVARDTKKLSAAMEVFVQDRVFRAIYLEKNREKLFNYGQPLFQNLKNKYGITHCYFILPDGHCFVRLHNKNIYGDLIKSFAFQKARDTKQTASGIELGKTAYALRVIMPYYNNNKLIGYVEFGEEISHFLDILKGDTDNDFMLLGNKKYMDKENWKSVRRTAGLEDNWEEFKRYVIIGDTGLVKKEIIKKHLMEKEAELIAGEEIFLEEVKKEGKEYISGGFPIIDAGGYYSGAVLSLINVTDEMRISRWAKSIIIGLTIILLFLALGVSYYISRSISTPVTKLRDAAAEIGRGNLDTPVQIKSEDEIGVLAGSFKKMAEELKISLEKEKKYAVDIATAEIAKEKAEELVRINEVLHASNEEIKEKVRELEVFQKAAVGRELKMIELKNRIRELEEKQ